MKNFFLSAITFLAITITCKAQWTAGTGIITTTNNVGIGTTTPVANLSFKDVSADTGNSGITWYSGAPLNYGIYRTTGSWTSPNYQQIEISWDTGILLNPGTAFGKSYVEVTGGGLCVTNGNVAIGTTNSKGYKLAVNGTAIATSMTVKAFANWPDYVFKPAYQLPSLTELKTYIDKNQHLPGVPAAAEVEKNGLNLGEMNATLLKKVEELTLYLIEKDKEIKGAVEDIKKVRSELEYEKETNKILADQMKKLEQMMLLLKKETK